MATYLDDLLDTARDRAAALYDAGTAATVRASAEAVAEERPAGRLHRALSAPGVSVIAEVKRASPSRGDLAPGVDARTQATRYLDGGASAISVLTEPTRFKGELQDLTDVSDLGAVALRKDFVIDPVMVHEAAAAGASGVLLIVAALTDEELRTMHDEATRLGLDVLDGRTRTGAWQARSVPGIRPRSRAGTPRERFRRTRKAFSWVW